jgi:hypothetical protein
MLGQFVSHEEREDFEEGGGGIWLSMSPLRQPPHSVAPCQVQGDEVVCIVFHYARKRPLQNHPLKNLRILRVKPVHQTHRQKLPGRRQGIDWRGNGGQTGQSRAENIKRTIARLIPLCHKLRCTYNSH